MRLCVPRYLGETEIEQPSPALRDAPHPQRGETMIVVDDEPTARMLITEVLELRYRWRGLKADQIT